MSIDLELALASLVPGGPDAGDWDDVLARAGVWSRRKLWIACALAAVLIALLATPALGVQGLVLDLLGRKNVSFANSPSAPNEVKKEFADLAIGAPPRFAPHVDAARARVVATFSVAGHPRKLWVAPTRRGGYCYTLERSIGGCRQRAADRARARLGVTWMGGPPKSRVPEAIVTRVAGDLTAPSAAKLTAAYADGTRVDIPFVWVSRPIAAGFFTYDVPAEHWNKAARLLSVTLIARDGRVLGRQAFPFTTRSAVVRIPTRVRGFGPRGRPLAAQPAVAPTEPAQRGAADGFSVVVGRNGAVQFTQTGTTAILRRLRGASAGFGCFRLTREFGIFTVRGLSVGGRFAPRVGLELNGVGTPVDGCEVQASIGRRWPDVLRNHAAVEIPLTAAGRAFFADRAAARDVALFVRTRAVQRLRAEPPAQALRDIRARYGSSLAAAHVRVGRDGNGLRFSKRSPTGKTFSVVVRRGRIAAQNVRPYAFVF